MIAKEVGRLLQELAGLVDQDERRILEAAQRRLAELGDAPGADDAERALLERIIARSRALLCLGPHRTGSCC